jgi:tetratricopeptide (TPR) repeat protein
MVLMSIISCLDRYVVEALDKEDFKKLKILMGHGETFLNHPFLTPLMKSGISAELGTLYYELGSYKKAKDCLEMSLQFYTENPASNYENLAKVSKELKIYWNKLFTSTLLISPPIIPK